MIDTLLNLFLKFGVWIAVLSLRHESVCKLVLIIRGTGEMGCQNFSTALYGLAKSSAGVT